MRTALNFICVSLSLVAMSVQIAAKNPPGFELFLPQAVEITTIAGKTSKAKFYGFRRQPTSPVALLLLEGDTEMRLVPLKDLSESSNELLRDHATKVVAAKSELERDLVLAIRKWQELEEKSAGESAKWFEETLTLISTTVIGRQPLLSGKEGRSYVSNREQYRLTELVLLIEKNREKAMALASHFSNALQEIQRVAPQGKEPEILERYLQHVEEIRRALASSKAD